MTPRPIEELIEDLDDYTGFTKYDLVDEAVERREEITPHLLAIMERMLAAPERWLDEEHDIHCYALVLMTHFGETKAHRLIVDLFSLPGELPYELFGDMVGETLPAALVKTCGGSLDSIRELVLNRQADDYCRWSACSALGYAVVAGLLPRDEAMEFLKTLLTGNEAEPESTFWDGVIATLNELHPVEALEEIRRAYGMGLAFDNFAPLEEIEKQADRDRDEVLAELREEYEQRTPDNIHQYMNWWQESGKERPDAPAPLAATAKRERKQKDKRRKKSKMAKKSRKRNR